MSLHNTKNEDNDSSGIYFSFSSGSINYDHHQSILVQFEKANVSQLILLKYKNVSVK